MAIRAKSNVRAAVPCIVLTVVLSGCGRWDDATSTPKGVPAGQVTAGATGDATQGPTQSTAETVLTATVARDAVLELLRQKPHLFVGDPDPNLLADLPIRERGDGAFTFGAFVVEPERRYYTAEVGADAPEFYAYRGTFERQEGSWIAREPTVQRMHRQLR